MKQCLKCGVEHLKNGNFCSRSCANSRTWTKEINDKKSVTMTGKKSIKADPDKWRANLKESWLQKYLATPFNELGPASRKRRVLEEQNGKCNHCGISEWNFKVLTLEMEHKDGNTQNNVRENLECICPNCHSQTSTWRGRNNKGRIVPDEVLIAAVKSHDTVSAALRSVGLPDKGSSHARAKRLLEQ